jgi:hypothetical protein
MKYIVALLLLSTVVYAQPRGTPFGQATTSPLKLYVNPSATGASDSNTCLNAVQACLTPQGAYNKVPKQVKHPVTINLACGTYAAGAYVEGDSFLYDTTNGGGLSPAIAFSPGIIFSGALQNATLTSGSVTGTIASSTQGGTSNPSTSGTFTVTAAGWTINDLVGRFVQITGGTDVGEIRPINANTATVATIDGNWAVSPDATSTFAIVATCSVIHDGIFEELPPVAIPTQTTLSPAAFIVREPLAGHTANTPQVVLQYLNINPLVGGSGIRIEGMGSNVLVQNDLFTNAGGSNTLSNARGFIVPLNGAIATIINNVFSPVFQEFGIANNTTLVTVPGTINVGMSSQAELDLRYNLFLYGSVTGNTAPVAIFGTQMASWQNYLVSNGTFDVDVQGSRWISSGDHFTLNSSGTSAVTANFFTTNSYYTMVTFQSAVFTGSSVSGSVGVNCDQNANASHTVFSFGDANSTMSNFGVPYRIAGFNCTLNSSDSSFIPVPSGTVNTDIQFGEQKTSYTMAQLTAQSPKVLIDPFSGCNIFDDGERSQTTWLPGGYHLLTSIPYANLLTCDALHTGAQAWDTTNQCVSTCNGTVWGCVAISPGGGPLVTSGPLSLFVATTGADSSNCQSAGSPCLTIDYARQQIPPTIQDQVVVNVAAGTYSTGAYISGFTLSVNRNRQPTSQSSGPSLKFACSSYAATTLSQGSQTGTVTSSTQSGTGILGSGAPGVWGTMTATGSNWAVNNLAGHLLQASGGTCTPTELVRVESNTATVATIDGVWPTQPDATCTYAIVDPACTISGVLPRPPGALGIGYSTTNAASFFIGDNQGMGFGGGGSGSTSLPSGSAILDPPLSIEGFNFTAAAPADAVAMNSGAYVAVRFNSFSGVFDGAHLRGSGSLWFESNYANLTAGNSAAVVLSGTGAQRGGFNGYARVFGNYITGSSGTAFLTVLNGGGVVQALQNHADTVIAGLNANGMGNILSSGNHYIGLSDSGIDATAFQLSGSPVSANLISSDGDVFTNNAHAIVVLGGRVAFIGTAASGSGNTKGMSVKNGGVVDCQTAVGYTSTTDIEFDSDIVSTGVIVYTLAQLRFAVPKTIINFQTMSMVREN